MLTYLSVDLDFYNPWSPENVEYVLRSIIELARQRSIPVLAVTNHQQLLSDVNRSRARRLVNVDEHSDITEGDIHELDCGTWISYVRWRASGRYHWVRNHPSTSRGSCNAELEWNEHLEWPRVTSIARMGSPLVGPDYVVSTKHPCVGIGLCMSPSFSCIELQRVFRHVLRTEGVRLKKGRLIDERLSRRIRPPRSVAA